MVKSIDSIERLQFMNTAVEVIPFSEQQVLRFSLLRVLVSKTKEKPSKVAWQVLIQNLVDLAGSERLSEYQERPESSSETGHINKSLFALSQVINKLAEGKFSHIPYRDSKLTRILADAVGGNSLTAIVCNVSPAAMNYGQTLSTIRFALRAKNIQNKVYINEVVDNENDISKFRNEIGRLREEQAQSNNQLILAENKIKELTKKLNQQVTQQGNQQFNSKEVEISLEREKDRANQLEKELSKALESQSIQYTEFTDKYQRVLDRLQEERQQRMLFEKRLKDQENAFSQNVTSQQDMLSNLNKMMRQAGGNSVPLIELSKEEKPLGFYNQEFNFVDNLLFQIDSTLTMDTNNDEEFESEGQ